MFANTQQVRSVIRAAKAKHGDTTSHYSWTDKTKAARDDDSNKRRHVVFVLSYASDAVLNTVKAEFLRRGYSNPVAYTDDRYLRVDADIA